MENQLKKFNRVLLDGESRIEYMNDSGYAAKGWYPLLIIRLAWSAGINFEDLADGFGPGLGTLNGDWSGIRDSSESAIASMLERALNCMTFHLED